MIGSRYTATRYRLGIILWLSCKSIAMSARLHFLGAVHDGILRSKTHCTATPLLVKLKAVLPIG